MKGSCRSQGDGSYELRATVNGIPWRETFYGTEEDANAYLDNKILEFKIRKKPKQANITFGKFLDIYEHDFIDEQLKRTTKRLYNMTIRKYIRPYDIVNINLRDLTAGHVEQHYIKLRKEVSLNIVKDVHTVMCSIFRQAYIWDYIEDRFKIDKVEPIPAKDRQILKKKAKQKRRVWSAQTVYDFLVWIRNRGQRRYFIYLIALTVGFRRGENMALRWDESINFEKRKINISGSITDNVYEEYTKEEGSYRSVHMFNALYNELKLYKELQDKETSLNNIVHEGWVHSNPEGKLLMRPDRITHLFQKDIEAFNQERIQQGKPELPKITLHDQRHTCATLLNKYFGVPIEIVSEILGHKSGVDFTKETYIDDDDVSQQISAFQGFNNLLSFENNWEETSRGRHMCSDCVMMEERINDTGRKNLYCKKYDNWCKPIARVCEGTIKQV
jgi:integrase